MLDLLNELEDELSDCKRDMKNFNKSLSHCLSVYEIDPSVYEKIDQETNEVSQNAKTFSFTKSKRFKEEIPTQPQIPLDYSIETIKKSQPNVVFSKTQRFQEPKAEVQVPLEPNYDFIKKKVPGIVISESRISDDVSTQASMTVGPGSYNIEFPVKEQKQNWGKEARFQKDQIIDQLRLNPNIDAIKPSSKAPKISKPIQKTKQLIQKAELERMDEQLQLEQYRNRKLVMDDILRANVKGPVIQQSFNDINSHPIGSKMRRFFIRKLIEDLQNIVVGPGQYEIRESKAPCMVVFKSHSTERRIPPDRPVPGPDYYYSKDDYIRPNPIQVKFGNEERMKTKKKDLDMRPDLDVNLELVKPKAPDAIPWDVKETKPRKIELETPVGPGYYEPEHEAVEKRILGGKIAPINDNNDRIAQMDPLKGKDFNDYENQLYPSLDPIKPHKLAFQYHEDTEHQPAHAPDKDLFPEQHKFYDVNLDVVREQIAKDILIAGKKGTTVNQWLKHVDDLKMFTEYLHRQDRQPEVGQYDVNFKQVDPNEKVVDFERYIQVDHEVISKPEGNVDGDNLLLNPRLPEKHIPGPNMEKQSAINYEIAKVESELVINPTYDLVKPRVKNVPDFAKQLDRPPSPKQKEVELHLEVNYGQIDNNIPNINIEKQPQREDDPRYQHKVDDRPLLLEPKIEKKTQTAVQMNSKTKRFNHFQIKQQVPPAVNLSKIEKAEKHTRPNIPGVNMARQSSRPAKK